MRAPLVVIPLALVGCPKPPVPPQPAPPAQQAAPPPTHAGLTLPQPLRTTTPGDPAPLPGDDVALTRVAFASCNGQTSDQSHWTALSAAQPDLFVFLGDNVYGDRLLIDNGAYEVLVKEPKPTLDALRLAYHQQAGQPLWQDFWTRVPTLPTWDDHDYGLNDAGGSFPHKARAEELFLDFWRVPGDDPRRAREGVYHAWSFGPEGQRVQILLLDTRTFRSDLVENKPGRGYANTGEGTMLGERQWAWLEAALAEPADLRLVVSSIQVVSDSHRWERWDTLPAERTRLLELVAATPGALLLTGDRHLGGVYRATVGSTEVVEVTSSSLNKDFLSRGEPDERREGPAALGRNFGLLDIDWEAGTVSIRLHDETGAGLPQHLVDHPFRPAG